MLINKKYEHLREWLERLPEDRQLALALVWISDQHADSAEIERRMVSLLQRIAEKTANAPAQPQTPTTGKS